MAFHVDPDDPHRMYFIAQPELAAPAHMRAEALLERLPSIPIPASSDGYARVGKVVYLVGGHLGQEHFYEEGNFSNRMLAFDLTTGRWKELAPRPVKAQGFHLAASPDGRYLYAFGGLVHAHPDYATIDTVHRYDTQRDGWETVARMPRPRSSYVLGVVDSRAYLVGGWDATRWYPDSVGRWYRSIDVFDLSTGYFVRSSYELPFMQGPVRRAFDAVTWGNRILVVGGLGMGGFFDIRDEVASFDPTHGPSGSWESLASLPVGNFAPGVGILNDTLYMFGGFPAKQWAGYTDRIFSLRLDEPGASWREEPKRMGEARSFVHVVPLDGNKLVLIGGHNNEGPSSLVEIFTP